jgi:ligand-binding SRPBCC domain-containing protein
MAHIEESIEINAPAEKVFAFTADAAQWSRWHTAIPEAEQTSKGPIGVGTTFKGVTRLMGRSMPWTATATEYEPNTKFGKNIDSGSVFIEQHNSCTPIAAGTKFTLTYDMKFSGCMRILSPFIVNAMRKEMKKSLINVKQIVEK